MLFILFGNPGVGKTFVGRVLENHYQFYFYDADQDLTPAMLQSIREEKIFTQVMRDEFFERVSAYITELQKTHAHIAVSQGLAKEINRLSLKNQFPQAQFCLITADKTVRDARLLKRSDGITPAYANRISQIFEPVSFPHHVIDNNTDVTNLTSQFDKVLNTVKVI